LVRSVNGLLQQQACIIEAADLGEVERARYFWTDIGLGAERGASCCLSGDCLEIELQGVPPAWARQREKGVAARQEEEEEEKLAGVTCAPRRRLLHFLRPIPRARPAADGAWERASARARERAEQHQYRWPVAHYEDKNGKWGKAGWRWLSVDERKVMLGYEWGHLHALFTKGEKSLRKSAEGVDLSMLLISRALSCPVGAWLAGR